MRPQEGFTRAVVLIDGFDPRAVLPAIAPHPAFRDVNGAPAADALLQHLAGQGITDVWLVCRTLPGLVVHYFGDGSRWGIRATHLRQDGRPGSGGALMAAREQLTETTLIIDGALATDMNLSLVIEAHRRENAALTMCLAGELQEAAGLPRARVDRSTGRVSEILIDSPPQPDGETPLYGVGVYIAEPEAVEPLWTARVSTDWVRDILPTLAEQGLIQAWQAEPGTRFDLPRRARAMHS